MVVLVRRRTKLGVIVVSCERIIIFSLTEARIDKPKFAKEQFDYPLRPHDAAVAETTSLDPFRN